MTGVFLTISTLCALFYGGVLTHQPPSALRSAVKTGASLTLLAYAFAQDAPLLICAGLACGVVGDFWLSRSRDSGLLPGLAAFFLGHLAYLVWALTHLVHSTEQQIPPMALLLMVGLIAITGGLYRALALHLGALRHPVQGYFVLSLTLGLAALALASAPQGLLFAIGVMLFIASDMILGLQIFRMTEQSPLYRLASTLLWGLYWLGQLWLLWGALAYTA